MSGLSRTPGKRVWDNIPTGVRIPPSPPVSILVPRFGGMPHGRHFLFFEDRVFQSSKVISSVKTVLY